MSKQTPNFKPKSALASVTQNLFEKNDYIQAPPALNWSDVDNIYKSIGEFIMTYANEVNTVINVINETRLSNKEVEIAINQGKNDLKHFTDVLAKIRTKHEGKTGDITNVEDSTLSHVVFQEYYELQARLVSVSSNTLLTLTEYLGSIADKNAKTNPDIITDVTFN